MVMVGEQTFRPTKKIRKFRKKYTQPKPVNFNPSVKNMHWEEDTSSTNGKTGCPHVVEWN